MAVLSASQLGNARHHAAAAMPVTWTKPQIHLAVQAIENAMTSSANVGPRSVTQHIGQAIEAAVPTVFSAGQKDTLFVIWSFINAARGGIL